MNKSRVAIDSEISGATGFISRRNRQLKAVLVHSKGAGLGAEVPLKIVPLPTETVEFAAKITFITDDVAANLTHSRLNHLVS